MKTRNVEISDLSYLVLAAVDLADYAWSGDVTAVIHKQLGQKLEVSVVKPVLQRMEKSGMLSKKQEPKAQSANHPGAPRVIYKLTTEGRKALKARMKLWTNVASAMAA